MTEKNESTQHKLIPIDTLKGLLIFLVGWIGFQLISILVQLIFIPFINESTPKVQITAWINFSSYLILAISLLAILFKDGIINIFKDFAKYKKVLMGILYGVIVLAGSIAYNLFIQTVYPPLTENANEGTVQSIATAMPFISFLMIVVLAPVCEELTYRYALFGLIYKKNRYLAYIISPLLFGLIHSVFLSESVFSITSQEAINELLNLPSYIFSGFMFCFAYEHEESLATSITAHMTNNLVAFASTVLGSSAISLIK